MVYAAQMLAPMGRVVTYGKLALPVGRASLRTSKTCVCIQKDLRRIGRWMNFHLSSFEN